MDIVFVASGSRGNATLIREENTLIQIDMGVPKKEILQGLSHLGLSLSDIQALFLTHSHSDHTCGVPLYHGKIPIYTGEGTLPNEEIHEVLEPGVAVSIGDLTIMPFAASHDAPNPLNFLILGKKDSLVYVTDTGTILEENLPLLQNRTYYLFESNHDYRMLYRSSRPLILKDRVASDVGHLSNADSALYLEGLIGEKTKQIFLAHISEECNTLDKALQAHRKVYGTRLGEEIELVALAQRTIYLGGDLR